MESYFSCIFTERGRDCRYPKVASWTEGSLAQENDFSCRRSDKISSGTPQVMVIGVYLSLSH